ncbi:MAG TPA: ABC transporter substrate-binding protein [Acidimicrobiales bacterium]|nr:ABC transporter substrate-binding protein [Acidimicrobiales bacterium]
MALVALVAGACTPARPGAGATPGRQDDSVVVASFNFSESEVLAEIFAQALATAGVPATHQRQVGPRELMEPALEQGLVDVVPEYLGSALAYLDPASAGAGFDTEASRRRLADALAGRGVTVLAPAPAQNQNGVAVTPATAELHGLSTVSDLAPVAAGLVFAGPPECRDRPFCLPGLRQTYGLEFQRFLVLDSGGRQTRAALDSGDADVGLLFTTDGHVAEGEFVLLEDDRSLQPPENIVPLVRQAVLERWGEVVRTRLEAVTSILTTEALAALNAQTGIEGEDPAVVAGRWLVEGGLVPG